MGLWMLIQGHVGACVHADVSAVVLGVHTVILAKVDLAAVVVVGIAVVVDDVFVVVLVEDVVEEAGVVEAAGVGAEVTGSGSSP